MESNSFIRLGQDSSLEVLFWNLFEKFQETADKYGFQMAARETKPECFCYTAGQSKPLCGTAGAFANALYLSLPGYLLENGGATSFRLEPLSGCRHKLTFRIMEGRVTVDMDIYDGRNQ